MSARKQPTESGFVTMIVLMVLILGAVVYLAYRNVTG